MEKVIIAVPFAIAALLAWAILLPVSCSATRDFFNEPVKTELVETDDCPPWCAKGCKQVEGHIVKGCQ